eukprot:215715-Amphidinium_carterae.1
MVPQPVPLTFTTKSPCRSQVDQVMNLILAVIVESAAEAREVADHSTRTSKPWDSQIRSE